MLEGPVAPTGVFVATLVGGVVERGVAVAGPLLPVVVAVATGVLFGTAVFSPLGRAVGPTEGTVVATGTCVFSLGGCVGNTPLSGGVVAISTGALGSGVGVRVGMVPNCAEPMKTWLINNVINSTSEIEKLVDFFMLLLSFKL